jgi:putative ABC transport system permease protein
MWRNYLTVAFRSLTRKPTYAAINVFGLALGLAACLLLLIYVRYETSYDSWLPDAGRVFQVQTVSTDPDDAESPLDQYAHGEIADSFARAFPEIEAIVRIDDANPVFVHEGGEEPRFAPMALADESFFRVLPFRFLRGDRDRALATPDALVLSRSEAVKHFGGIDIIGRTVRSVRRGEEKLLRVTGVFEDLPRSSHMEFAIVGRLDPAERAECGWGCVASRVYVKLRPGADPAAITARLPEWERRAIPPVEVGGQMRREGDRYDWRLVALRDVHLSGAPGAVERPGNDRRTLLTFAIVAALILGMAAINFINLSTARASQRAREVSLRKVLGATRGQLIAQFLIESVLVSGIAILVAVLILTLSLPWFAAFLDTDLEIRWLGLGGLLMPVIALWTVVGVAGGLYPAFHLSRYRPAEVLKANKSGAEPIGTGRLRSILVVAQFAVSIGLIVCTLVVQAQTRFAQSADLGFERDGLIQVANANRAAIIPQTENLIRQVARIPGVESVAGSNLAVAMDNALTTNVQVPGRAEPEVMGFYSVSPEFFATMRLRLVAGRLLSRDFARDDASVPLDPPEAAAAAQAGMVARGVNVVVNEAAARQLGFAAPEAAVGRTVGIAMFGAEEGLVPATIVGVVANGRFRSARDPIEPQIFFDRRIYNNLVLRYAGADPEAVRRQVGEVWRRLAPEVPFEAAYADQRLAALYAADAARAQTFAAFAGLAVVIACLGLFALAAFTADRRTKEIGIRKTFGARGRDIVALLAWQFAKPVILANLIAAPIAWWVMRDWLNTFDARIALGPTPFLIAAALALAIALGTVAGHALRVSRTNPIHALRYE